MSKEPKDPKRREPTGGKAGRSPGKTTRQESTSGGKGRDRPMPGYAQRKGDGLNRKPPPEDRPPTKPKDEGKD